MIFCHFFIYFLIDTLGIQENFLKGSEKYSKKWLPGKKRPLRIAKDTDEMYRNSQFPFHLFDTLLSV